MSIIVSNSQHCNEQQFQTLSVHYTIFSVVKLDLFKRVLLLDRIHALEKYTRTPRVHLVLLQNNNVTNLQKMTSYASVQRVTIENIAYVLVLTLEHIWDAFLLYFLYFLVHLLFFYSVFCK